MSSQAVQQSLNRLRSRLVRTARGFHDYNFRQYFVQHAKDDIAAVQKLPLEDQQRFLASEGPEKLRQMQRMVIVNRLYARQPVFFDKKVSGTHLPGKGSTQQ